jgi:hypothetical protein
LKDLGSLIGGATALLAGGIAYWAGRFQAKATRRAADMQIAAERERHDRENRDLVSESPVSKMTLL